MTGRFKVRRRKPYNKLVDMARRPSLAQTRSEAAKQAQQYGLDPMIGFLHAPSFGRESLACDLVEPLRPRIDIWVERLFRQRTLRREHFSVGADGACLMGKAGRAAFYDALGEALPAWGRWLGRSARVLTRWLDGAALPAFDAADEDDE